MNRPPPSLPLRPWERVAAWTSHRLLYLALLALPIAGYLIVTADGKGLDLFGLLTIPAIVSGSEPVRAAAAIIHTYGAYGLLALVAIHAGGAVKHHAINRDRTLLRMIRGR